MALEPGTRFGSYEAVEKIGSGGMGEVWRASDATLKRDVAVKVLPASFVADADRVARFQREAEILASLNHPNIATIHGLEQADGQTVIVMELVEGRTLADRIADGPIPPDEATNIAQQIISALEAAHQKNVVHRDLKPANIKLRDDGTVKILDFGISKPIDIVAASSSPVMTTPAVTQTGVILGTAAYMSPEQARGKFVDQRTDIWAFGCLLFEMLTGQPAFGGEDVTVTIARVLERDADVATLPAGITPAVRQTLRLCLQKNPQDRLHSIADARLALSGAFAESPVPVTERRQPWALAAAVLTGVIAVGIAAGAILMPEDEVPRIERFVIGPPEGFVFDISDNGPDLAITPDGSHIVFQALSPSSSGIFVRPIGELDATLLVQSNPEQFQYPFVSFDSEWAGFNDFSSDTIRKQSIYGGPAITIGPVGSPASLGVAWGTDGTIVFGNNDSSGLFRISDAGDGIPEPLTSLGPGETNHAWPEILPGGDAVLFTIIPEQGIDQSQIALYVPSTGEQRVLVQGGSYPRYAESGHIIYAVDGTLRAVEFDLKALATTGNPVPVLDRVVTKATGGASFSLSKDGTLIYMQGDTTGVAGIASIVRLEAGEGESRLDLPARVYDSVRISPDGTRAAFDIQGETNSDIWVSELALGTLSPVTTNPAIDRWPLWTPDGERVVFGSNRGGLEGLYIRAADGRGDVETLLTIEGVTELRPYYWSPDSEYLIFSYNVPETSYDLGILSLNGDGSWRVLLDAQGTQGGPQVSPDGAWVAYNSNEGGQHEIYIERFPDGGGRRQISTGGGVGPVWGPDGRTLVYRSNATGQIMRVTLETEPTLAVVRTEVYFEGPFLESGGRRWDMSADGEFFLMIQPNTTGANGEGTAPRIVVVKNWIEQLKQRVPN